PSSLLSYCSSCPLHSSRSSCARAESKATDRVSLPPPPPHAFVRQFLDDAVQRSNLLLGQVRPLEHIPDVADHYRTLVGVAQETAIVEFFLEMGEEVEQLGLGGRARLVGNELAGGYVDGGLEPLIADDQHRLREIER